MNADRLLQHYEQIADAPDAIARLRRFILDLAVRGKLVPQDPADESASELLKRITVEKAQLVKTGELKETRDYNLASYVEDGTPSGWKLVPLGQILKRHLGGGTPSKSDSRYWGGDILWASVKDVGKSKYLDNTQDRITQEGLDKSSSNLIPPGNLVVVTRMGLGQLSINRVPVAINQDLRALFLSSFLHIEFVYNFFLTYRLDGTGLTVKGIKLDELLGIPFPLPPLAEQYRIVTKVDELMALCDELETARAEGEVKRDQLTAVSFARLNAPDPEAFNYDVRFVLDALPALTARPDQIKQLRQTILNLAVRGKLVPQDPKDEPAEELLGQILAEKARLVKVGEIRKCLPLIGSTAEDLPFEVPNGWACTRLGNVIHLVSGQHLQPPEYSQDPKAGLPYITGPSDFGPKGLEISRFALVRKAVAKQGQLLLTVKGSGVGKTTLCDIPEVAISRQLMALTAIKWNDRFLMLITHRLAEKLQTEARSLIPGISRSDVDEFVIALPPLAEQHRIVAKVEELMALCDQLEASLMSADVTREKLFDALLAEALAPVETIKIQEAAE